MAVVDTPVAHDDHHDDHGEFIAHHFDSAEQQFDSGKLGIWIFLVTEVLFFSGLFVAYTLWRNHHPEVFDQAHVYLDKTLGFMNTIVLLFSSLTMALAVRAAQLGKNKNCAFFTLVTMVCAAVFLGVKAVEYSHKWDMGIFVRSGFHLTNHHASPTTAIGQALHISDYLVYISIIPALLLVAFLGSSFVAKMMNKDVFAKFLAGLAITAGGYFLGAIGGQLYQKAIADASADVSGGGHAAVEPLLLHAATSPVQENESLAAEDHEHADKTAGDDNEAAHSNSHDDDSHAQDAQAEEDPNAKLDRDIGTFFSIYYCMTGLHAIHIIGGIIALSWIFWRSLLAHWRSDYFGPVDYVGLYWHLVDLIWIFLFPLLYLID